MHYSNHRIKALPNVALRNHFFIQVNGVRLCYCYIRKNASSSFKQLFMDYTSHVYSPDLYDGKLDFLRKKHSALRPLLRQECDASIVVLRDPLKRAVSHFINKAVSQIHAHDFSKNYKRITGKPPADATFREFATEYLDTPWRRLDLHVWPQSKQLWPITYTHALSNETLTRDISGLLGPEITQRYFAAPMNASWRGKHRGIDNPLDRPSRELASLIRDYDVNAELEEVVMAELGGHLRSLYREDYNLLDKLSL